MSTATTEEPAPAPSSPTGSSESDHSGAHESHSNPTTNSHGPSPRDVVREKKRRRPALACEQCRKRKVRCDRLKPCGPCIKAKITQCTYAPTHTPKQKKKAQDAKEKSSSTGGPKPPRSQSSLAIRGSALWHGPSPREEMVTRNGFTPNHNGGSGPSIPSGTSIHSAPGSTDGSTPASADSHKVNWLKEQVAMLQARLDNSGGGYEEKFGQRKITKGFLHHQRKGGILKVNYFSQGHWMHGAYLYPMELALLVHAENTKDMLYWILLKCKDTARRIKANRFKPLSTLSIGQTLPARALADQLIKNYFHTFEGLYRILHRPTFWAEYDRMWQDRESTSQAFVVQAQVVMAIGAALNDETYTMRCLAMQWLYEAKLWLMMPPEKDRLTYTGMQIMCLVTLAGSVCSVAPDIVWLGAGSLIRTAMFMGLHRDPRQLGTLTRYRAELRRRLWATILELDLQAVVDAGGNPDLLVTDYDTLPPANIDDEAMTEEPDVEEPEELSVKEPTQTSVQILLQQTHGLRVAIFRHTERSPAEVEKSYDDTLHLNSELTKACRWFSKSLQDLKKASEQKAGNAVGFVTSFHVSVAELILYRCFHFLHQPVIMRSLEDPRFYFSKKMYLDSALKMAHICHLTAADKDRKQSDLTGPDLYFDRFMHNSAGMVRNVVIQVLWGIGLRLIHLKEEQSLSMGYFPTGNSSTDLREYIAKAQQWTAKRIRSGETGVKIHCFVAAAIGHSEQVDEGADIEAIQEAILKNATEAAKEGLQLLQELAVKEGTQLPADDTNPANGALGDGVAAGLPQGFEDYSFDHLGDQLADGMEWITDWPWHGDAGDFSWAAPQQQQPWLSAMPSMPSMPSIPSMPSMEDVTMPPPMG